MLSLSVHASECHENSKQYIIFKKLTFHSYWVSSQLNWFVSVWRIISALWGICCFQRCKCFEVCLISCKVSAKCECTCVVGEYAFQVWREHSGVQYCPDLEKVPNIETLKTHRPKKKPCPVSDNVQAAPCLFCPPVSFGDYSKPLLRVIHWRMETVTLVNIIPALL